MIDGEMIVFLSSDLMFTSTISGVVGGLGKQMQCVGSVARAADAISGSSIPVRLVVDLSTPGLNLQELAKSVSPEVLTAAIAYGPHVHEVLLAQAQEAGIGTVISRGQFNAKLRELLT